MKNMQELIEFVCFREGCSSLFDVLKGIAARWRQLDAAAEMPRLSMLSGRQVIFLLNLHRKYGPGFLERLADLDGREFEELRNILAEELARKEARN